MFSFTLGIGYCSSSDYSLNISVPIDLRHLLTEEAAEALQEKKIMFEILTIRLEKRELLAEVLTDIAKESSTKAVEIYFCSPNTALKT